MLEKNVQLEETLNTMQTQLNKRDEDVHELEQKFSSMEGEMKKALSNKTTAMEKLQKKAKKLSSTLDETVSPDRILVRKNSFCRERSSKQRKRPMRNCRIACNFTGYKDCLNIQF